MIGGFLIIHDDENTPLITKLVFVGSLLDDSPTKTCIGRQEGITVLCTRIRLVRPIWI